MRCCSKYHPLVEWPEWFSPVVSKMLLVIEAVLFIVFLTFIYLAIRKPPGLPPGVWGLPIIGKFPSTSTRFGDQVKALRDKHGDIITWRVGSRVFVFLCNHNIIKRALNKTELTNRPDFYTFVAWTQGRHSRGILLSDGLHWLMNRRFVLRHLRDFGMGKSRIEQDIHEEAFQLVQCFRKLTGKSEFISRSLGVAPFNVLWKMLAGTRLDLEDPRALELVNHIWSINDSLQGPIAVLNFLPWLGTYGPEWVKKMLGAHKLKEGISKLYSFAKECVEGHLNSKDSQASNEGENLIKKYLSAMNEDDEQDSVSSLDDLCVLIMDLFVAGTETTSSSIRWAILYLAKYPEVQERVQKELDEVVPKGTFPLYQDRSKLPYFEAVVNELYRIVSLSPLAVPHVASHDTTLDGYNIPKGTVIMPHLECCHKDPNLWEKPDQFYPEHFLDSNGKFVNREGLMPFSVGRRVCVGESLARVEVFVYLAALLQNFTFTPPEGEELSTENDPGEMTLNIPTEYKMIITERA